MSPEMFMKVLKSFVVAAVLAGIPLGFLVAADPLFKDEVVARGKGFEIKQSQLDEAFVAFKASAMANRRPVPEAQRSTIESNLLDRLIVSQILLIRATPDDKAKAKEKSDEFLKEVKSRVTSESLFRAQLKAMGITPEKFETRAME